MAQTLKVYGFLISRADAIYGPNGSQQTRNVVAAHSIAEVLRLANITRTDFNWSGAVTGNLNEIAIAMTEPGVVFWVELDMRTGPNPEPYKRDDSGLRAIALNLERKET